MFKQSIFAAIAILSIATTADARPRSHQHRAAAATISCDDRGCSDRRLTVRAKVHSAGRHRAAAIRFMPRAAQARIEREARFEVRQGRRARSETGVIVCNQQGCTDRQGSALAQVAAAPAVAKYRTDANGNDTTVLGGRPAGCPHAFCGCEASRYVFGEMRPELYLATNWIRKFPRAMAAPGMAAVRSGHVMVLISHMGGNDWLVHDGNSGGGLTRRHVRSISGHVIVDPQGARTALR